MTSFHERLRLAKIRDAEQREIREHDDRRHRLLRIGYSLLIISSIISIVVGMAADLDRILWTFVISGVIVLIVVVGVKRAH